MSFYQKNVQGKVPDWTETFEEFSESTNENVHYFVCTNEASLVYMANLGCIEMNPWHSTIKKPDNPDYCLIDLDPHEIGFDKVIETAQTVKRVLDQLKIPAWCKTSGATGLHICIPLGAKYNYDQSRQLAELLVNIVHHDCLRRSAYVPPCTIGKRFCVCPYFGPASSSRWIHLSNHRCVNSILVLA